MHGDAAQVARGRATYREKTPSRCVVLSTTVLAGSNLVSNPGLRGKRTALNDPRRGMIFSTEIKTNLN